jgi:YHS domain-containing protein
MKKFVAALMAVVLLALAGCSSVQGPSISEEVRYEGQCALGVSKGDCDVKGFSQWKVQYKGKVYYFKDEISKDSFLSDLDRLIQNADKSWEHHVEARH